MDDWETKVLLGCLPSKNRCLKVTSFAGRLRHEEEESNCVELRSYSTCTCVSVKARCHIRNAARKGRGVLIEKAVEQVPA